VNETSAEQCADAEARQSVDNIQYRFLERIGDRVASGLSMRELSEELIIEALTVSGANYGCVLRLDTDGALSLNAAVSSAGEDTFNRQHDTLLNRQPDSLMSEVIKNMKATFSNNARRMLSANLPSCHPRVHSFALLPMREKSLVTSLLFIANAHHTFDLVMVNR